MFPDCAPVIGDSTSPLSSNPLASIPSVIFLVTRAWVLSLLTRPPLEISSLSASNCGLISVIRSPPGSSTCVTASIT